jgi:hypothetical protein
MEVDAILADSVAVADGKLFVQGGGWNVIRASAFPARHPRVGLGLVLRVGYLETGEEHRLEVRFEDSDKNLWPLGDAPPGTDSPDGKLYRLGGALEIPRPDGPPTDDEQAIALAMNFDGMVFEQPGLYRFVIAIDDDDLRTLPVRLMAAE